MQDFHRSVLKTQQLSYYISVTKIETTVLTCIHFAYLLIIIFEKLDKAFKNGPGKICGRQPLNFFWRGMVRFTQTIPHQISYRLFSTNFTRSILECFFCQMMISMEFFNIYFLLYGKITCITLGENCPYSKIF